MKWDELTELPWLARLMAGDASAAHDAGVEPAPVDAANPFFAGWMLAWARKLVIARMIREVSDELKRSAGRIAQAAGRKLPQPDWNCLHSAGRLQLQRGLAAMDIFPRCTVLLTMFEGLSLQDTAILLDADQKLIAAALAIGLADLARHLSQGWNCAGESRVPFGATLGDAHTAM